MEKVLSYLSEYEGRFLDELFTLLRFPSVSSQSQHNEDVKHTAKWLKDHLGDIGLNAEIIETEGHPLVYAEWLEKPGKPTMLVYGHYDVQPEDPVDLWDSPPFEPTIKGAKLFCRGSADDKGQLFAHVKAIEAFMKTRGELPINVKLLIEGEEEVGSENLTKYLHANPGKLACDLVVVSDSPMYEKGIPTLTLGLRGLVYFQLNLTSSKTDLHSGSFGGGAPNAANAACEIVSKLKDDKYHVLIPGFYDDVKALTAAEKESIDSLPFDADDFMAKIGLKALVGEEGYSTLERLWVRPTCDVMGIESGYTGEGAKTVIPAKAMVKLSMRIVPDQDPEKIRRAFEDYVRSIRPEGVDIDIDYFHGGRAYAADPEHPASVAAISALEDGFGQKAAFNREGGSIPIVNEMADVLGAPCLLFSLGLPDENAHAPNENFDLDNFKGGMRAIAHLLEKLESGL